MKRIILIILSFCLSVGALAQNQQFFLEGVVYDENTETLVGATIVNTALQTSFLTDENGNFKIKVRIGDTLSISFMGYNDFQLIVKSTAPVRIDMKPNLSYRLSEATVVGYSKQERRDITGSVSSVKLTEHKSALSIDQLLQGQAPGVFVSGSSGSLGAANLLTIRGINSIMGDNNPLYVVDGVPIYGTDRSSNLVGTSGGSVPMATMGGTSVGGGTLEYNYDLKYSYEQNPLMFLNPDDIESIEILKDAFATSIYGSRGAAGVILITTKSGGQDKLNVNVTYSLSLDSPMGKPDLLNGSEYSKIYSMYYPSYKFGSDYNTDWLDAVTRTAISHSISANVSGGTNKSTYYISVAASDNQSYIINNELTRYSIRTNLNTKFSKKWSMGTNTSISSVDNNSVNANTVYGLAMLAAPNNPIYNEDGSYYYGYQPNSIGYAEAYNPVATAMNNKHNSTNMNVVSNTFLEYKALNWLTLKSEFGTNVAYSRSSTRKPTLPSHVINVPDNSASENVAMNNRIVWNNTLDINKVFNQNHFLQGVVGQSYEFSTEYSSSASGSGFFSDDLVGVGTAESIRVGASTGEVESALLSVFTRLNYQAMQRYMIGVSYRLDGSSRYNKNHRFIHIPSVSLAWRLSEEPFVKNNMKWVDDWKIRGSVGWSSKDANNTYYGAQAIYSLSSYKYGQFSYLDMTQPGNVNLNWEKTITYDLGMDISFLEGRLKGTLDYYYKLTTDMLFSSDLPAYTGYSKQSQNIADMQNQGFELQLYSYNIVRDNFSWMTILNFSTNSNKILKLDFEGNQLDQANSSYKFYAVGYPIAQWYLHTWKGVDPATGEPLWVLADGTITTTPPASNYQTSADNKTVYGTAQPLFYGSLSNALTYRNWEVNMMMTYSVGGRMINSTRASLLTYSTSNAYNLSKEILNFWQMDGQNTDIPKLKNKSIINNSDYTAAITSSRYIEDSSYLKLKSLSITYRIPQNFLNRMKINTSIKFYVMGTNLLTFTKYSGIDPEVSAFGSSALSAGYDNMTMPQSRGYQFGIKVGL